MTHGRPPNQAIGEALAIAGRQGRVCKNTRGRGLLYDFTLHLSLITICVQVKRIRPTHGDMDLILSACRREIVRIRRVPETAVFIRELWVRSSAGNWQYFLVLDDRVVEIAQEAIPERSARNRHIGEDAPGPDRSSVQGESSGPEAQYFCPFMGLPK
ncbi:hypothetical protein [Methanoregula sp.]|uniref:hypothetical protein n=1 Tax=Methanoregula sp. TaxID=2052170 RepID=UPI003569CEC0